MRKLLCVVCVFIMSIGFVFAQDILGKTKEEAKKIVSERISPSSFSKEVGTTPTLGYDKWMYSSPKPKSPLFYCYFNSKGICFLECVMTNDKKYIDNSLYYYCNLDDYKVYQIDPDINKEHEFIKSKTTIELVVKPNNALGGNIYYLWIFDSENKDDVQQFFEKYYSKK